MHKCTEAATEEGHHWTPHRSGYQCALCSTRIHQGLTTTVIKQKLQEPCEGKTSIPPEGPDPELPLKKMTQLIQELLQNQPTDRIEGKHQFIETAGYIKRQHCGNAILKKSNETIWHDFINSPCVDEAYSGEAIGHQTHLLWQLGNRVTCKHCGIAILTDKDDRLIITQALKQACKGTHSSPPARLLRTVM